MHKAPFKKYYNDAIASQRRNTSARAGSRHTTCLQN